MNVPPLYESVVNCSAGCPTVKNCNVDPTLPARFRPRGTTSRCEPGHVELMVILANPGTPQDVEDQHYGGEDTAEVAAASWRFTEAVLERRARPRMGAGRSVTHDVLMRHLAEDVFDCAIDQVLDRAVVTNAVKCSTPGNFGSYPTDLRLEIGRRCAAMHLEPEVAYWRPRVVIACGRATREVLATCDVFSRLSIEIIETHHPSALGRFIAERKEQFQAVGTRLRSHTTP